MLKNIAWGGFADPVSSLTHLAGAAIFALASLLLVYRARGDAVRLTSVLVYSFSVVFLLSMSGLYHGMAHDSVARRILRQLDHAGIWILIAGSFTPLHGIMFRGFWRWGMLSFIWGVAIVGLVIETLYINELPEFVPLACFLSLGWLGLASGIHYIRKFPGRPVRYLLAGGIAYSLGAVIDFNQWLNVVPQLFGYHEIFHLCVIAGAGFHWVFTYRLCAPVFQVFQGNS